MSKRNKRKPVSEINVVPYIDVMLVLLVIFMITAPLITAGVKVDLPQADAQALPEDKEPPLIASVTRDGKYYLSVGDSKEQALSLEELVTLAAAHQKLNPKTEFVINGDQQVNYGAVVQLMVTLQKNLGVSSVGLMTEPPQKKTK